MSKNEAKTAKSAKEEGRAGEGDGAKEGSIGMVDAIGEKPRNSGDGGDRDNDGVDGAEKASCSKEKANNGSSDGRES